MSVDHVKSSFITNLDASPSVANTAGEGGPALLVAAVDLDPPHLPRPAHRQRQCELILERADESTLPGAMERNAQPGPMDDLPDDDYVNDRHVPVQ